MIRGLLLAGGASTRFGSPKLLHPFGDGLTLGQAAARNLIEGVGNALAVVRAGDAQVARALRAAGCEVLETERSRDGLGASLAAAVAATREAQGWVVALADMPRIAPALSRAVAAALDGGALLAAPVHDSGVRGHPVGFSMHLGAELLDLTGDDGARSVVARHRSRLAAIPTADRGVLYDVDRPEDLECR